MSDAPLPPWRFWALGVFVALVCVRLPGVVWHGRFWAEEGTIFYHNAVTLPWWRVILRPELGYVNLSVNLCGLLASLAPIDSAPHITTLLALVLQSIPALLLVTARDAWLRRPIVLFAAVVLVATPPLCDEIWLNTTTSHIHLILATALCLALDAPAGKAGLARAVMVFLTPLCGPGNITLAPLFVLRAALERQPQRIIQAGGIVAGSVLQLAVFYTPLPSRAMHLNPVTFASILAVKHLAIPLLGEAAAIRIAPAVQNAVRMGHVPVLAVLATLAALGLLVTALAIRRQAGPAWLLAAAATVAVVSYFGALDGGVNLITVVGGQRYAFTPCVLTALCLLAVAATGRDRIGYAAWGMVAWLLTVAVAHTVLPQDQVFMQGPDWHTEVMKWRADPTYRPAIWPARWHVQIPPKAAS